MPATVAAGSDSPGEVAATVAGQPEQRLSAGSLGLGVGLVGLFLGVEVEGLAALELLLGTGHEDLRGDLTRLLEG
jgi:hypothetical protein